MKRLGNSDSLGAGVIMTISPSTAEEQRASNNNNHQVYGRDPLQSMVEGAEEEEEEEAGHHSEKKRRLSVDQVKALEKNFEVENKLEPERKVKLAHELGLQPRQVAVWFQNRRARWKTKQLERDYGVLKANYEALKLNFDALKQANEALHNEIKELKSRVHEEDKNTASGVSVVIKEETITTTMAEEEEDKEKPNNDEQQHSDDPSPESESNDDEDHLNYDNCFIDKKDSNTTVVGAIFPSDFKDGASDSDSSAIFNEDMNNSPKASNQPQFNFSFISSQSSIMNCFQFQKPLQYVKMEEHNFFSADEACNFFSDEQAPTLHWYSSDQWG